MQNYTHYIIVPLCLSVRQPIGQHIRREQPNGFFFFPRSLPLENFLIFCPTHTHTHTPILLKIGVKHGVPGRIWIATV